MWKRLKQALSSVGAANSTTGKTAIGGKELLAITRRSDAP